MYKVKYRLLYNRKLSFRPKFKIFYPRAIFFAHLDVLYGDTKKEADHGVRFILGTLNLAYQLIRQEKEALKHRTDLEQKLLKLLEDVPDDTPPSLPL
jgi:hypothetical protein